MTRNKKIFLFILIPCMLLIGLGYTYLTPSSDENSNETPSSLTLLNWEEYIDTDVLVQFTEETSIEIILEEYGQSLEMTTLLQANPHAYDIIITDEVSVHTLAQSKLLSKIDFDEMSNFKHVPEEFRSFQYGKKNEYSVPYLYGSTGIAANTDHLVEPITSWNDLLNPAYNGKVVFIGEPEEAIIPILGALNKPVSEIPTEETLSLMEAKAKEFADNNVRVADSYDAIDMLVEGDAWIIVAYNGDIIDTIEEFPNIEYIIPIEGSNRWIDNLSISGNTEYPEAALSFLDFMLRPEISAQNSNTLYYANPNKAAEEYMHEEILTNPAIYPPQDTADRLHFMHDTSSVESRYNLIYTILQ